MKILLKYPNNMFYEAYNKFASQPALQKEDFIKLKPDMYRAFVVSVQTNTNCFCPDEILIMIKMYTDGATEKEVASYITRSAKYVHVLKHRILSKIYSMMLLTNDYNDIGVNIVKLLSENSPLAVTDDIKTVLRNLPIYYIGGFMSTRLYNALSENNIKTLSDLEKYTYTDISVMRYIGEKSLLELDNLMCITNTNFKNRKEYI